MPPPEAAPLCDRRGCGFPFGVPVLPFSGSAGELVAAPVLSYPAPLTFLLQFCFWIVLSKPRILRALNAALSFDFRSGFGTISFAVFTCAVGTSLLESVFLRIVFRDVSFRNTIKGPKIPPHEFFSSLTTARLFGRKGLPPPGITAGSNPGQV